MNPGSEKRIEELVPLTTNVEHQGVTQEEVLQSKARCHPTKVEEIPAYIGEPSAHCPIARECLASYSGSLQMCFDGLETRLGSGNVDNKTCVSDSCTSGNNIACKLV